MTDETKDRVDKLNEQAWQLRERDPRKSYQLAQEAYDLLQSDMPNYVKGLADNLSSLAHYNQITSNFELAFSQNYKAVALYQELGDSLGYGNCLSNFVKMYHKLGDYSMMLEYALRRLQVAEEISDQDGQKRGNVGIGLAYMQTGDYVHAVEHFEKALTYVKKDDDRFGEGAILGYIANALTSQEKFDEALEHYQRALTYYDSSDEQLYKGYVLGDSSDVHLKLTHYDEAFNCFQQQIEIGEKLSSIYLQAFGHLGVGRVYAVQGQLDKAIERLLLSLKFAQEGQIHAAHIDCLQELAAAYKQQGDFENALLYFEQYHQEKELVFNAEADRHRKNLMVIHETQQAQTEAKLQAQLRQQDRMHYENLSKMKDNFISTTTHDLKSPLNSIQLAISMLQKMIEREEAKEYLTWIDLSIKQMYSLVVDTLDIARLETGLALQPKNVNIVEFVSSAVKSYQGKAKPKNINLEFETKTDEFAVVVDPLQIRRVLDNLLSNAIKYTQNGGHVQVKLKTSGDNLEISVIDDGPGISDEDVALIFTPYYRIEDGPQVDEDGTGLGLSIVKTIVKQHGGKVHVASKVGQGSHFAFTLPIIT